MRQFNSIFNFQLKKVVNKRNMLVFLVLAIILHLFLQVGKASYNDTINGIDKFQSQEQQKTSKYSHYRQYGTIGIWLKFIPHASCILFYDSTFDDLLCNADSSYVCNIYTPLKGRKYFASRSRFLNFSVMFLLFTVLGCIAYGTDTTSKRDYLKFISILSSRWKAFWFTIISRIIILFLAGLVLYAISVLPLLVFNGINLFNFSFPTLLVIILVFSFFFGISCLVGLIKQPYIRFVVLVSIYFGLLILLPWGLGFFSEISAKDIPNRIEYDFKNFNLAMQEDEYLAKKHGLPKSNEPQKEEAIKDFKKSMIKIKKSIKENEERLKKQSLDKIKTQQTIAAFFPTLFYISTCESNGSVSVINLLDFHTYCIEKKERFADVIIENSFPEKDKPFPEKVENFIKGDEDLFFAKPKLPYNFWLGVFLTPFYTVLLLLLSFRILKKRLKVPEPKKAYQIEKEKGNTIFVLCENALIKEDIFNYYQNKKAVCLKKINTGDFMFNGVKAYEIFKHLSIVSGVDESKAREHLAHIGIKDLRGLPVCIEVILKMYAAVKTAADSDLIVLNDFLKNESREFEKDLFNLFLFLEKFGKKIIYLSCQMKHTANYYDNNIKFPEKVNGFKAYPMDCSNTTVR